MRNTTLDVSLVVFILCTIFSSCYGQVPTVQLRPSNIVKDFGPIFAEKLQHMADQGGGILEVQSGTYPILTPISVRFGKNDVNIKVIGKADKTGTLPILLDTLLHNVPHSFFLFKGNRAKPSQTIEISNLEIVGNNIPYSSTHPFVNKSKLGYSNAIGGFDLLSCHIENVTIRNFYGRGIMLANYSVPKFTFVKKNRMISPVVRNCKIMNVWAWSKTDDSGDGIEFWSVLSPTAEGNIVLNDLSESKHYGRVGIVLEHNTENAIIRNNTIGGYSRNIHIECDWGGHVVDGNKLVQSRIGIRFSEDCKQPSNLDSLFKPTTITNNHFQYNQEFEKLNIQRGDIGFVSIYKPSPVLEGMTIKNNRMYYSIDKSLDPAKTSRIVAEKNRRLYLELKSQKGVIKSGNSFN